MLNARTRQGNRNDPVRLFDDDRLLATFVNFAAFAQVMGEHGNDPVVTFNQRHAMASGRWGLGPHLVVNNGKDGA